MKTTRGDEPLPTVVRYGLGAFLTGWSLAVVELILNVTGWLSMICLMGAMGAVIWVGNRIDGERGDRT